MIGKRIQFAVCWLYLPSRRFCFTAMMRSFGRMTLRVFHRQVFWVMHFEAFNGLDFCNKSIWKSKAPTKACIFAWAATNGKIPTESMLKRSFSGPSGCSTCSEK